MALKFVCPNCGNEIVVKYLKPGELAKCRDCGAEVIVPEDADLFPDSEYYSFIKAKQSKVQESSLQESNLKTEAPGGKRRYKLAYWLTNMFIILGWMSVSGGIILSLSCLIYFNGILILLLGIGAVVLGLLLIYLTQFLLAFFDIENHIRLIYKILSHTKREGT